MKIKKLTIETNGKRENTKVLIDGKVFKGKVTSLLFEADQDNEFVRIQMMVAKEKDGTVITKKMKVRDDKSSKMVDRNVIVSEAMTIEFDK